MLSFNDIGNLGRLGNQMFQYAALKGIAKYHQYEFCIPPLEAFGSVDTLVKNSDANLYSFPKIEKNKQKVTDFFTINEESFRFDENLFLNCELNTNLKGYFQTEKYFNHIANEIRQDFKFGESMSKMIDSYLLGMYGDSQIISIHVRRGDYMQDSNFVVLDLNYYESALKLLDSQLPVMIFSNDIKWCEEQELFKSKRFKIMKSNSTLIDLCLMSKCHYHIIANSSYSWWGAWLAKSQKVIAPQKWFAGSLSDWDTTDLYCSGWVTI